MDGFPIQGLAGMVREGLLKLDGENSQAARAAAADILIGTGASPGPGTALAAVEAAISTLTLKSPSRYDEDGNELPERKRDLVVLNSLRTLLNALERCTPLPDHSLPSVLERAACFIKTAVRTAESSTSTPPKPSPWTSMRR